MSDYIVVTGEDDWELERKVNAKLKEGYKPVGSVNHTVMNDTLFGTTMETEESWSQAMIRE